MRIGSNFLHENLHPVFLKFTQYPSGWVVPPVAYGTLPANAEISSDVMCNVFTCAPSDEWGYFVYSRVVGVIRAILVTANNKATCT